MKITRSFFRTVNTYYLNAEIAKLIPEDGLSILDVLDLDIPAADRIWIATRPSVLPRPMLLEWLARLVERALPVDADLRSRAIVELLRTDNVTDVDARAAWAAARAFTQLFKAETNAAWAAEGADEERQTQIADLKELLQNRR